MKRAAERLNLTQPAISKTLKELETVLGARLFSRSRAGVRMTAQGEVFEQFAETSLAALTQGVQEVAEMALDGRTRFAIGALPSVAARLVPYLVEALNEVSPRTVPEITEGPHEYLLERLRQGALDLVIGRLGAAESMGGLSFTQLYEEHVAFVVRPGHPLSGVSDPRAVIDWPVIYPTRTAAIRPLVDRFFLSHGIGDVPNRIETVSAAFGRVQTQRSDAVWIISAGVVATEVATGVLAQMPVDTTSTRGPVGLTSRPGNDRTMEWQIFRVALDRAMGTARVAS